MNSVVRVTCRICRLSFPPCQHCIRIVNYRCSSFSSSSRFRPVKSSVNMFSSISLHRRHASKSFRYSFARHSGAERNLCLLRARKGTIESVKSNSEVLCCLQSAMLSITSCGNRFRLQEIRRNSNNKVAELSNIRTCPGRSAMLTCND